MQPPQGYGPPPGGGYGGPGGWGPPPPGAPPPGGFGGPPPGGFGGPPPGGGYGAPPGGGYGAPPGGGYGGPPMGPPQPPRSGMSGATIAIIVIVAVVVFGFGGCLICGGLAWWGASSDPPKPKDDVYVYVSCKGDPWIGFDCLVHHQRGNQRANACWDVKVSCHNGSVVRGHACQDVAPNGKVTRSIRAGDLSSNGRCNSVASTSVENVNVTIVR